MAHFHITIVLFYFLCKIMKILDLLLFLGQSKQYQQPETILSQYPPDTNMPLIYYILEWNVPYYYWHMPVAKWNIL